MLSKDDNDAISHKWYDNIADALTALAEEDAYRIEINKDCDETIALSNAREVYVNKNVTVVKLEATDAEGCVGTGTLGGSNASGGSIRIGAYANATLYSGTLTGNNVSGDGGAVSVTGGNCSFTMYGGAITGNTATGNGGGISSYDSWNAGTVNINDGVISNNRATGDDNTAFIWIALLLICASTAAVTVIYGRRKKRR